MNFSFDVVTILAIIAVIVVLFLLFKVFKLLTRIILVAVFLLIAFLTNPGDKKHQEAVDKKAREGKIKLITPRVKVKDLWVASLTQVKDDGDEKTIGIGLFTKVFVFRDPD